MPVLKKTKYDAIRIMLQSGADLEEAAKTMEVTVSTAKAVKSTNSYEDCLQQIRANVYLARDAYWRKKKEKAAKAAAKTAAKAEPKETQTPAPQAPAPRVAPRETILPTVTLVANHYLMEEIRKQTELLRTISAKVGWLVEELSGSTPKGEQK
jgi:hypothetical protein